MKKLTVFFVTIAILVVFSACGKGNDGGGGGGGNQPNEANLVVDTDPSNGVVQAPSLGPFNLKITVTSVMPPNGVKIEISAKKDDGSASSPFFSTSTNSTAAINNFAITNTPSNVQSLVEIKITSLTKSSNVWSGSYRYSRK